MPVSQAKISIRYGSGYVKDINLNVSPAPEQALKFNSTALATNWIENTAQLSPTDTYVFELVSIVTVP